MKFVKLCPGGKHAWWFCYPQGLCCKPLNGKLFEDVKEYAPMVYSEPYFLEMFWNWIKSQLKRLCKN